MVFRKIDRFYSDFPQVLDFVSSVIINVISMSAGAYGQIRLKQADISGEKILFLFSLCLSLSRMYFFLIKSRAGIRFYR